MGSRIVREDRWGEVIDRPDADVIEIRWYDTTRDLDRDTFNAWLDSFAGAVESSGRSTILTDATSFLMPRDQMDGAWRDANITPRYDAAGIRRFAFLLPDGSPPVGAAPQREGAATFPTGYFDRREDALAWLRGTEPR